MTLSHQARSTLHQFCLTLVPVLEQLAGDEPALFIFDAHSILPLVDEIIDAQSPEQLRELSALLWLLEQPLFMGWLCGKYAGFSALGQTEREAVLRSLARSRLGRLRKGFQAVKRLACFLFYANPDEGVWSAIGYSAARGSRPGSVARIPITRPADELDCDACVIGSGAGGGVIAAELARLGRRVIVLEAGPATQADEFDQRELAGMRSLYLKQGLLSSRDLSMMIVAGSALGGGTAVNWQTSLRTPDDVRDEWADRSGCSLFREDSFTTSLDIVMKRLQVGTSESQVNPNNDALRRGCEALGYQWSLIPRNAHGCDPAQCGYCMFGCRVGGKQSTTVTWLHDAIATGNASVIANCTVQQIEHARGSVMGVSARLGERTIRVRARTVVLAAGGIESPALLLRSGISLPALGRHLYLHPTTCIVGFYAEPVRAWLGPPQSIVCNEFARMSGGYGFRLETAPTHPGLFALALPWQGARAHRESMQSFDHAAAFIALTRDQQGGRVSINRRGETLIDYPVGTRELGYLNQGMAAAARVHAAAGAQRIVTLHAHPTEWHHREDVETFVRRIASTPLTPNGSPLFSAHQMGTCRMGTSADSAVCNENGEVFGVKGLYVGDASAFPASCGVNPMITVMALAHHTAGRLSTSATI